MREKREYWQLECDRCGLKALLEKGLATWDWFVFPGLVSPWEPLDLCSQCHKHLVHILRLHDFIKPDACPR